MKRLEKIWNLTSTLLGPSTAIVKPAALAPFVEIVKLQGSQVTP